MKDISFLTGKPVDLAPWCYMWRRDKEVQDAPEAYFIPRRLKRIDEVYRTALPELGDDIKSPFYKQDDLLSPLLPKPEHPLLCGALWVGGLTDYTLTLRWNGVIPELKDVEVRTYPTAWGWFGWTVDHIMANTMISDDRREWKYSCPAGLMMDYAYSTQTKAATEMLAVFAPEGCPVPELIITGDSLGEWKRFDFAVEWGIGSNAAAFDGGFKEHVAHVVRTGIDNEKRIATFSALYSEVSRFGNDSKFTLDSIVDGKANGVTVLLRELVETPVYVPEQGVCFYNTNSCGSAAEYINKIEAEGGRNIRQLVREHLEAKDWNEVFDHMRRWRCGLDGAALPEFPGVPKPQFELSVPDKRWQAMYENAVEQMRGPNMWGMLSEEVGRVTYAMELNGLYEEADRVYDYFLESPGIKSDGDFSNPAGSLEWAKGMRHDMGYFHEGTHSSTGLILFSMMHRYLMTADRKWFAARVERLKKAASWMINEMRAYLSEAPNRDKLLVYGLLPPEMLGDYALPACDWHWYYCSDAFALMGLNTFVRVLRDTGDPDADYYASETKRFTRDLDNTVTADSILSPVRRGRDGKSRSFIPRMPYAGGLLHYGAETNIPQFAMGINDLFMAALPLADPYALIDARDPRIVGTVDAMEEAGASVSIAELRKLKHPTANNTVEAVGDNNTVTAEDPHGSDEYFGFWNNFTNLPKISRNADVYLREDDIPNFLHYFFNASIMMVGTNGKLWEHAHPDSFVECKDPDNGTAGWFAINYRNMLLMEEGETLWIARGTPRSWLAQGCEIKVNGACTEFGDLSYRIISDTDSNKIRAEIKIPSRNAVGKLKLRLRHPEGKKLKRVSLPGAVIDADGETVIITAPTGTLDLVAEY